MTRAEFIDAYIERSASNNRRLTRTENGFRTESGWERIALPCACGEDECEGWAMVTNEPEMVADHMQLHTPSN